MPGGYGGRRPRLLDLSLPERLDGGTTSAGVRGRNLLCLFADDIRIFFYDLV